MPLQKSTSLKLLLYNWEGLYAFLAMINIRCQGNFLDVPCRILDSICAFLDLCRILLFKTLHLWVVLWYFCFVAKALIHLLWMSTIVFNIGFLDSKVNPSPPEVVSQCKVILPWKWERQSIVPASKSTMLAPAVQRLNKNHTRCSKTYSHSAYLAFARMQWLGFMHFINLVILNIV